MAIVKKRTFWLRVQEAMRDKGMKPTQGAAAVLIGIKQPSVNKWAKGKHPSMEHVVELATKLNVNVEWLYTERGPKRPIDADSAYLLNAFAALPTPRLRDKALAYIDALADRGPSPDDNRHQPHLS